MPIHTRLWHFVVRAFLVLFRFDGINLLLITVAVFNRIKHYTIKYARINISPSKLALPSSPAALEDDSSLFINI